ncbi:MAG: HAMP domain-containing histidine kinase [Lachnospiraceae bacterium]|nr:HAMP domain-containing histidine kinase [Lachnospiraceae bacterium]
MEWLWGLAGVLTIVIVVLGVKIYYMHKAVNEIGEAFADRLDTDTNTLIGISSNDKYLKKLAQNINVQLRLLREQRRRYQQGDLEIKEAITNISHDLRTPLTAIFGYLELLSREEKSSEAERYLGIIQNRADLLKQLTEELFDYSIMAVCHENLKREPVEMNRVLEESVAAFYTELHERGIEPVISMPEEKVVCRLDRDALARVFANLFNNAVKYSSGDLEIKLSPEGKITFTNTAPDLDEVQVGRLFDRFYTVETAGKSTGLGLSIARTLVERMGGKVEAGYENGRLRIEIWF